MTRMRVIPLWIFFTATATLHFHGDGTQEEHTIKQIKKKKEWTTTAHDVNDVEVVNLVNEFSDDEEEEEEDGVNIAAVGSVGRCRKHNEDSGDDNGDDSGDDWNLRSHEVALPTNPSPSNLSSRL